MEGTCLLIDLLMKRIFSNVISSPNLKMLLEVKRFQEMLFQELPCLQYTCLVSSTGK